jgi:hypothetical protein
LDSKFDTLQNTTECDFHNAVRCVAAIYITAIARTHQVRRRFAKNRKDQSGGNHWCTIAFGGTKGHTSE